MHGTFNTMQIMDRTGHTSITWDPDKAVEVGVARDSFDKLIKEGYRAFKVEGHDNQGERMTTFDRNAGKIMMLPHLVGG
jgi:hypothetical protein